jgi:Preprotein translocase SecG subunit
MDMINSVVIVLLILSSLFLIVTILMHSGRGSGLSDMFGGTSTLSGGTALERTLRPDHRRHRDHLRALQPVDRLAVEPVRGPSTDC